MEFFCGLPLNLLSFSFTPNAHFGPLPLSYHGGVLDFFPRFSSNHFVSLRFRRVCSVYSSSSSNSFNTSVLHSRLDPLASTYHQFHALSSFTCEQALLEGEEEEYIWKALSASSSRSSADVYLMQQQWRRYPFPPSPSFPPWELAISTAL